MTKSIATASINRETAGALIDAALIAARAIGIPAAVAVVDATGYLRAFERTDDAPFLTVDVAIDKAWSSASFGYPTHVWNDYVWGLGSNGTKNQRKKNISTFHRIALKSNGTKTYASKKHHF